MNAILLLGRIFFVVLFLTSGIGHLTRTGAMTGYAKSKGLPMPGPAVIVSGLLFLLGSLSVLLGVKAWLGALAIAVTTFLTAVLMHAYWKETDGQARMTEMVQFNKDLALSGASLMLVVLFHEFSAQLGWLLVR